MSNTNQNNTEMLMHKMYHGIEKDMKEQVTLNFCLAWDTKNEISLYTPILNNMGEILCDIGLFIYEFIYE